MKIAGKYKDEEKGRERCVEFNRRVKSGWIYKRFKNKSHQYFHRNHEKIKIINK